jgi:GntR family transcriptional regulator/MocR family aminotransferase
VRRAAEADVAVYPTKKYWTDPAKHVSSTVLVGFSSIAEDDIEPGIRALAGAWFG